MPVYSSGTVIRAGPSGAHAALSRAAQERRRAVADPHRPPPARVESRDGPALPAQIPVPSRWEELQELQGLRRRRRQAELEGLELRIWTGRHRIGPARRGRRHGSREVSHSGAAEATVAPRIRDGHRVAPGPPWNTATALQRRKVCVPNPPTSTPVRSARCGTSP